MGLLNNILENDLDNFNEALRADEVIRETENKFYKLLEDTDRDFMLAIEELFGAFTVRGMRIAYIQGLKDFSELFIDLKGNTADILDEHIRSL